MAAKRSGLGKGLDGLFPSYSSEKTKAKEQTSSPEKKAPSEENASPDTAGARIVRISDLEPNPQQPRKKFDEDSLVELAESIREHGMVQPLIVVPRDGYYMIVAGERRWRAAKLAGLREVPVIVRDYTDQQIIEVSLIENIQREDLDPIEEAQTYQRLIDEFHMKQDDLASRVAKSRAAITNSLRLLKLAPKVQQMVIDGLLSAGHARALLATRDEQRQEELAARVFDLQMSVRETEKMVRSLTEGKKRKSPEEPDQRISYIYEDMETQMQNILGTKVKLRRQTDKKGRIEIAYYSVEELERIYELIRNMPGQA